MLRLSRKRPRYSVLVGVARNLGEWMRSGRSGEHGVWASYGGQNSVWLSLGWGGMGGLYDRFQRGLDDRSADCLFRNRQFLYREDLEIDS